MRFSYVSDHLAYVALPVAMAAIGAAAGLLYRRWPRTVMAAAAAVIVLLSVQTGMRSWKFADNGRLWRDVLRHNPDAWVAHNYIGVLLGKEGTAQDQARREPEAFQHFEKAIELKKDCWEAHANLAAALVRRQEYQRAQEEYATALSGDPENAEWLYGRGWALIKQGRPADAIEYLQHASRNRPNYPEAHFQMALAFAQMNQAAQAVEQYRAAIALRPTYAAAIQNLAWLLATCDDNAVRNGPEAVKWAERARELPTKDKASLDMALSAAYAEAGRFDQALTAAQVALAAAKAQGQIERAKGLEQLIEFYRQGKTYRDYLRLHP